MDILVIILEENLSTPFEQGQPNFLLRTTFGNFSDIWSKRNKHVFVKGNNPCRGAEADVVVGSTIRAYCGFWIFRIGNREGTARIWRAGPQKGGRLRTGSFTVNPSRSSFWCWPTLSGLLQSVSLDTLGRNRRSGSRFHSACNRERCNVEPGTCDGAAEQHYRQLRHSFNLHDVNSPCKTICREWVAKHHGSWSADCPSASRWCSFSRKKIRLVAGSKFRSSILGPRNRRQHNRRHAYDASPASG